MNTPWLMLASLVPMSLGPNQAENEKSLIVSLCNGGVISIPLEDGESKHDRSCHSMACHAGNCRKQALSKNRLTA